MGRGRLTMRSGRFLLAPRIVVPPQLIGEAREGVAMTIVNAIWADGVFEPDTILYDIIRDDGAILATGAAATYTPTLSDVGYRIARRELATSANGSALSQSAMTEVVSGASTFLIPATQTVYFGRKNPSGYGGHGLHYSGAYTLSVASGDPLGHWQIIDNQLVPKGAIAGVAGYGTKGPNFSEGYTLGITDGHGNDSVVTVAMLDHTYTIAPISNSVIQGKFPTDNGARHQLRDIYGTTIGAANWVGPPAHGDTIKCQPGIYNPGRVKYTITRAASLADITTRTGGPVAPTNPYTVGMTGMQSYDPATNAGWITVESFGDHDADLGYLTIALDNEPRCNLRFTNLRFNDLLTFTSPNNFRSHYYGQVDNCWFLGSTPNLLGLYPSIQVTAGSTTLQTSTVHSWFILNNIVTGGGGIFTYCFDSIINGNTVVGAKGDGIQHALYSETRQAEMSWNFVYDKKHPNPNYHVDFSQAIWFQTTIQWADNTFKVGVDIIGNIFVRGEGEGATISDGQGFFLRDLYGGRTVKHRILGNVNVQTMANGMFLEAPVDTLIAHNTLLYDYTAGAVPNGGNPVVRLEGLGDGVEVRDNISGGVYSGVGSGGYTPVNIVGTALNYTMDSTQAGMAPHFANPALGNALRSISSVISNLTPISAALTAPGAGRNKLGAVNTYIDHAARTYDFSGTKDYLGNPVTLDARGLPLYAGP